MRADFVRAAVLAGAVMGCGAAMGCSSESESEPGTGTGTGTGTSTTESTTTTTTTSTSTSTATSTSTSTSTSTGEGGAGGGQGASAACVTCFQGVFVQGSACEAAIGACDADPDCDAWKNCGESCFNGDDTPACYDACDAQHPHDAALSQPLLDCLCDACSTECAATCA